MGKILVYSHGNVRYSDSHKHVSAFSKGFF